jgi:hypothetical protein
MSVTINFVSPGNPPYNITQFKIERSVRAARGLIALVGDINNITKVVTVSFIGGTPTNGALAGDQMHINGILYRIVTNTATTITFTADTDLSTITSFPASFIILNDLAEFEVFEVMGTITPSLPFTLNTVHQFTDSTGTVFDFYRIKTVDAGGTVSASPLNDPFRPGAVAALILDEKRSAPKDELKGILGGSITFEVEVMIGGRRQDPRDNRVFADVMMPSYLSPTGKFEKLITLEMVRVGFARYRKTWDVPRITSQGLTLHPSGDYVVSYKANFVGLILPPPSNLIEFDSEMFTLEYIDAPIYGRFPAYATIDDLRQTFFDVDAYLPESIDRTDVENRNKLLQYHLERACDKLREELNMHQVRSNSSDRKEYVASRAVFTILMAARGQNSSAISNELLKEWRERAEYILAQLKREGVAQGIPMGRG